MLLHKDATLLVVSDVGVINDYGSFGWALGGDQELLWECKAIARGYPKRFSRFPRRLPVQPAPLEPVRCLHVLTKSQRNYHFCFV
jgi:hypothetical protein